MKKYLVIFTIALVVAAIAVPAFAAVEFQYGGQFRVRFEGEDNVFDGTNQGGFYGTKYNSDDNRRFIDQRLRLYFSFIASPNLKVVVKWEMGDAVWGMNSTSGSSVGNTGANAGANVGADAVSIEVKNAYVEFKIPATPTTARIGVQSIDLMDSWMIDDDFAAAVFTTKLDCWTVTLGYIGGQYGWERKFATTELPLTNSNFNLDEVLGVVEYAQGPFKASLNMVFQDAHNTDISLTPESTDTPIRGYTGFGGVGTPTSEWPFTDGLAPRNNYLFDLGVNLTYKMDWLMAYVNFIKNFGSADLFNNINGELPSLPGKGVQVSSLQYTGWMVDAGVTYYCGPWTANVGGFFTSGPSISNIPENNGMYLANNAVPGPNDPHFLGLSSKNANWFVYPMDGEKTFSEIIGGGVLGDDQYIGRGNIHNASASDHFGYADTVYWHGYGEPTNLWTVTVGGSYQLCKETKLSASYWYFGTATAVPVAFNADGNYKMNSSIGHELDFYIDQGIVDGLKLTLVGAYLFANDAYCPLPVPTTATDLASMRANTLYNTPHPDDAWEVGARIQWSF
jgi:hypothetical protein